jgi:chromosome partitioning protein
MGDLVMKTTIPRNVRISEAPSHAMPVLTYDPSSKGAAAYRALAREIADRRKTTALSEA